MPYGLCPKVHEACIRTEYGQATVGPYSCRHPEHPRQNIKRKRTRSKVAEKIVFTQRNVMCLIIEVLHNKMVSTDSICSDYCH